MEKNKEEQKNRDNSLVLACYEGDIEKVKRLIGEGADVNTKILTSREVGNGTEIYYKKALDGLFYFSDSFQDIDGRKYLNFNFTIFSELIQAGLKLSEKDVENVIALFKHFGLDSKTLKPDSTDFDRDVLLSEIIAVGTRSAYINVILSVKISLNNVSTLIELFNNKFFFDKFDINYKVDDKMTVGDCLLEIGCLNSNVVLIYKTLHHNIDISKEKNKKMLSDILIKMAYKGEQVSQDKIDKENYNIIHDGVNKYYTIDEVDNIVNNKEKLESLFLDLYLYYLKVNTTFIEACRQNNNKLINILIKNPYVNVNYLETIGRNDSNKIAEPECIIETAFKFLCENHNIEQIKTFIKRNDFLYKSEYNYNALKNTCSVGSFFRYSGLSKQNILKEIEHTTFLNSSAGKAVIRIIDKIIDDNKLADNEKQDTVNEMFCESIKNKDIQSAIIMARYCTNDIYDKYFNEINNFYKYIYGEHVKIGNDKKIMCAFLFGLSPDLLKLRIQSCLDGNEDEYKILSNLLQNEYVKLLYKKEYGTLVEEFLNKNGKNIKILQLILNNINNELNKKLKNKIVAFIKSKYSVDIKLSGKGRDIRLCEMILSELLNTNNIKQVKLLLQQNIEISDGCFAMIYNNGWYDIMALAIKNGFNYTKNDRIKNMLLRCLGKCKDFDKKNINSREYVAKYLEQLNNNPQQNIQEKKEDKKAGAVATNESKRQNNSSENSHQQQKAEEQKKKEEEKRKQQEENDKIETFKKLCKENNIDDIEKILTGNDGFKLYLGVNGKCNSEFKTMCEHFRISDAAPYAFNKKKRVVDAISKVKEVREQELEKQRQKEQEKREKEEMIRLKEERQREEQIAQQELKKQRLEEREECRRREEEKQFNEDCKQYKDNPDILNDIKKVYQQYWMYCPERLTSKELSEMINKFSMYFINNKSLISYFILHAFNDKINESYRSNVGSLRAVLQYRYVKEYVRDHLVVDSCKNLQLDFLKLFIESDIACSTEKNVNAIKELFKKYRIEYDDGAFLDKNKLLTRITTIEKMPELFDNLCKTGDVREIIYLLFNNGIYITRNNKDNLRQLLYRFDVKAKRTELQDGYHIIEKLNLIGCKLDQFYLHKEQINRFSDLMKYKVTTDYINNYGIQYKIASTKVGDAIEECITLYGDKKINRFMQACDNKNTEFVKICVDNNVQNTSIKNAYVFNHTMLNCIKDFNEKEQTQKHERAQ